MYRSSPVGQLSFENFYLPFGGKLSGENRWVKLAHMIPWEAFEAEYATHLSLEMGSPAKPFRMALGALIIKERLGTSDIETVEQIRENPYLQYFIGLSEYSDKAPFDASMMVHFRKRISVDMVGCINEQVVRGATYDGAEQTEQGTCLTPEVDTEGDEGTLSPNQGKLILDASCAPADITYPTDLKLLNEAREKTEAIIDELYKPLREQLAKKPRTYRRKARQEYLKVAKQRKANGKTIRKATRQQLGYLRRNLSHIDALIEAGASLSQLKTQQYRALLIISEVFRQQEWMYNQQQHRIDDRIVSLSQPHVRPIVRGKAGVPVEFGAKFSASCVDGLVFLDHLSWDNFNESCILKSQIEQFKTRFGHYPESVHADQVYRTRENRAFCRERGIRLSGPQLGRPALKDQSQTRKQGLEDAKVRNHIEGKFGQGKRRFSLGRIMAKLAQTAQTTIAICFLVMNLERLLKQLLFVFLEWLMGWNSLFLRHWRRQVAYRNDFPFAW